MSVDGWLSGVGYRKSQGCMFGFRWQFGGGWKGEGRKINYFCLTLSKGGEGGLTLIQTCRGNNFFCLRMDIF